MIESRSNKLRFGVFCRGSTLPAWQAECLKALSDSGVAEPALIILEQEEKSDAGQKFIFGLKETKQFFYRLYLNLWIDLRSKSMRPRDLPQDLKGVPTLKCKTILRDKNSRHFYTEDITAIKNMNLDFIVHFGGNAIQGDFLEVSRYGVWAYQHGPGRVMRGNPACLWEILRTEIITEATLQKLTEPLDNEIVLYRGFFGKNNSCLKNMDDIYFGSADWCARVCKEIVLTNGKKVFTSSAKSSEPDSRHPANGEFVLFLIKNIWKNIIRIYEDWFLFDLWNVALVKSPAGEIINKGLPSDVLWLPPLGNARFFADPFAIFDNAVLRLLVEDYNYFQGVGTIRELVVSEDFQIKESRIAIRSNVHMSFPRIFRHKNKIYCIPETSRAGKVYLFEKETESGDWKIAKVILDDFPAIDPVIFKHQNLWWLLCTRSGMDASTRLYGWWAEDLHGNWTEHALNPLKCDIRSARPAGPPFDVDGDLLRPAQDCSRTYGGAITINKICRLTPTEFEEESFAKIAADPDGPYPDGVHTLCPLDNVTIIDCKKKQFSLAVPFSKISHRLYRLYRCARRSLRPGAEKML